jgi:hypothetical protein
MYASIGQRRFGQILPKTSVQTKKAFRKKGFFCLFFVILDKKRPKRHFNRCFVLFRLIGQYLGMVTLLPQQFNQKRCLDQSCRAFDAQNPVTIVKIKIGVVVQPRLVYPLQQLIGFEVIRYVGLENFNHFSVRLRGCVSAISAADYLWYDTSLAAFNL